MKVLLIGFSILMMAAACNKNSATESRQEIKDARGEYQEEVNEAVQDKNSRYVVLNNNLYYNMAYWSKGYFINDLISY